MGSADGSLDEKLADTIAMRADRLRTLTISGRFAENPGDIAVVDSTAIWSLVAPFRTLRHLALEVLRGPLTVTLPPNLITLHLVVSNASAGLTDLLATRFAT